MKQMLSKVSPNVVGTWNIQRIRQMLISGSKSNKQFKFMHDKETYTQHQNEINERFQRHHAGTYSMHYLPDIKYNKNSIYLLGNYGRIYGFLEDDFNSNDQLLNDIETKAPNAIILGTMAESDMEYLRKGQLKYLNAPKFQTVKPEQSLAKKKFIKFFNEELTQTNRYFYEVLEENNDYTIYEADRNLRRKIARPQISAAKYACSENNKKLFFGSPNPLLVLEDLAYNLSLAELKDIFNNCMQIYHESAHEFNIMPSEHPIDIHNNLQNLGISQHSEQLYSKLLKYQASLLRKCTKIYKETIITSHNMLVDKLKKEAMDPDIQEFEEIYDRQFTQQQNFEETLEKLSILTHIFNREFQLYLDHNQQYSLQDQLFCGQFKDESQMKDKFYALNQKYRNQLQQLYNDDLKRLQQIPARGRIVIETYEEAMKRFDLKFERKYRFIVNPQREIQQIFFIFQRILQQVEANIDRRESQGIDQEQTRILLNQLFKEDNETPENLQLYRELIIEANTQLGYLSMPEDLFSKYKELMKMTTYDSMKEVMGEDPHKAYRRDKISIENQAQSGVYTQLNDGSVPSFEQFKAIKDKILKTKQGVGSKLSLIKVNENKEKTMDQYMQLEQIALNHPKTRERVDRLQQNLNKDYLPVHLQKTGAIFLNSKGDPLTEEQLIPQQNAVFSLDGSKLPFDIANKTVEDLKELGFKDIVSFDMKQDPITGGMKPHLPPQEKLRLQNVLKELEKDHEDPDYHQDTLGEEPSMNESLDQPKNKHEKVLFEKIKKQKVIDDQKIALIFKALEKGIPLQDDEVYLELLEMYPYYKNILEQKQKTVQKIKKIKENQENNEKVMKYKFEAKIKGRSNLQFIDIEPADTNKEDQMEKDVENYDKILKDYENDMKIIQMMSQQIQKDVIDENDAIQDVQQHLKEELEIERKLGNKFLAKVEDDEAGSILEDVNRRYQENVQMKQFFDEFNEKMPEMESSNKEMPPMNQAQRMNKKQKRSF